MFTLKQIDGAMIEPKKFRDKDIVQVQYAKGFNCAIDAQSSVPFRFNREKVLSIALEARDKYLKANAFENKSLCDYIADAIISADREIIELDTES